jgi:hypothetical protein
MGAAFVRGHRRDEALVPAALAMAWLCDTDDDGFVVEHDLRTLHEAFDLAPSAATLAMGHLDPAGSGRVGVDDLARAVCEYYVGDDPAAPGTWLFGTVDLPTPPTAPSSFGPTDPTSPELALDSAGTPPSPINSAALGSAGAPGLLARLDPAGRSGFAGRPGRRG